MLQIHFMLGDLAQRVASETCCSTSSGIAIIVLWSIQADALAYECETAISGVFSL